MSNSSLAREHQTDEQHNRNWARMREEVRDLIRKEVDKLNPTDAARRPLELIVESSVRYYDAEGQTAVTVVDRHGQPRTIERDGQRVPFTLQDLLAELRITHPMLFRPAEVKSADTTPSIPSEEPQEQVLEPEKPARDWLNLHAGEATNPASRPQTLESGRRFRLRRGKVILHGWVREKRVADHSSQVEPRGAEPEIPLVADTPFLTRLRSDTLEQTRKRKRLAIAGIVIAALIGIGGIALVGRHPSPPAPEQNAGPAQTGALNPAPAQNVEPSATSSPAPAPSGPHTLKGTPDVIDTTTLSLQGEVVRLFGVEWAPGGGKPDDLTRYLQGREVSCEPAGERDTYRCQVGGQDLSRVVLFNGGGKPTAEATPELKAAADKAREARVGVWSQ